MTSGEKCGNKFLTVAVTGSDNYIRRFVEHHFSGRLPDNDKADLLVWVGHNPSADEIPEIERRLAASGARAAVMLSSCSVYGLKEGTGINELAPSHSDAEKALALVCSLLGVALTILRLPMLVVGTGMDGVLMTMVRQLHRGTYIESKGEDGSISLIHASSIGPAIDEAAGTPGIFNLNDSSDTTVSLLADALSYRIGKCRHRPLKPKWAWMLARWADKLGIAGQGVEMMEFKTRSLTFSAEKFMSTFSFRPVKTTDYLKNHVYDETSL